MATEIKVPPLGESLTHGTIANWLKNLGDEIQEDEPILELETDKVTIEVNALSSGILTEINVSVGTEVEVGQILGIISEAIINNYDSSTQIKTEKVALVDIIVPDLGESLTEANISQWLKSLGDNVILDEPLLELETDKVTMEINAPGAGQLSEIIVTAGNDVEVGAVIGRISALDIIESKPNSIDIKNLEPKESNDGQQMSPAVRKMVEDNDLNVTEITATGKDGRLTKGDVLAFQKLRENLMKQSKPSLEELTELNPSRKQERVQIPTIPSAPREERVKITHLRKVIASRLKEAQNTAAILTTFNEIDMSAVMSARKYFQEKFEKRHDVRLGFMSYFVKAVIVALKEFPAVNAEIQGDEIVYKNYYNIGVAVGTPNGLVVPVLKDADKLTFAEIEKRIKDFGSRARDGKLTIDEMSDGSFTITNGGIYGSMLSTPIINAPQSGILGMHNIVERPWVVDGEIKVRPIMYLAHSYDHRIVDGREAVSMLVRIKECIEDPQRIMLDM